MKKLILYILILILISTLAACHTHRFDMQYRNTDGDLVVEVFNNKEDFNNRAKELNAAGIKTWLYMEE